MKIRSFALITLLITGLGFIIRAQTFEGETVSIGSHTVQILPLALVTESEPVVLDITDTSARVNFVGTIPLACYLVYGTDETFGFITNDPDMAQAAIIEHNPLLLNLEPDTEYVFRMQGIAENGDIYISDLVRFRTAPQQSSENVNLLSPANGATVREVSSNFGNQANDGRWGILNAFDNNPNTAWSSAGDGNDAYFIVDLDGIYHIERVEFQTRSMVDGSAITQSFTLTIDSGETFGPFTVDDITRSQSFAVDFETTSLRYDVHTSTGGNTGILDIALYGAPR